MTLEVEQLFGFLRIFFLRLYHITNRNARSQSIFGSPSPTIRSMGFKHYIRLPLTPQTSLDSSEDILAVWYLFISAPDLSLLRPSAPSPYAPLHGSHSSGVPVSDRPTSSHAQASPLGRSVLTLCNHSSSLVRPNKHEDPAPFSPGSDSMPTSKRALVSRWKRAPESGR